MALFLMVSDPTHIFWFCSPCLQNIQEFTAGFSLSILPTSSLCLASVSQDSARIFNHKVMLPISNILFSFQQYCSPWLRWHWSCIWFTMYGTITGINNQSWASSENVRADSAPHSIRVKAFNTLPYIIDTSLERWTNMDTKAGERMKPSVLYLDF